jgi:NTE family protein
MLQRATTAPMNEPARPRTALVLSGGGARGAYEAGVLAHVFESVLPRLGEQSAFDVASGTSVGAVHATFTAATSHLPGAERARQLIAPWLAMEIAHVIRLSARDLVGIPLRMLGYRARRRGAAGTVGGLVDLAPLEALVERAVSWDALHENLRRPREQVLCVSCTEVGTGRVTIFMEGPLADTAPWRYDPNAFAIEAELSARHVRASAAIPFLFPAVRIGDRHYVDGGLRMSTPLSPALRLRAERILVVALKHRPEGPREPFPDEVITQPAFLLGKVLDALTLDQLEYELQHIGVINALIERGTTVYGADFADRINVAVREQRGVGFRPVRTLAIRPSEDIGRLAAECHRESGGARTLGWIGELAARAASRGVPHDEADLLSYLYFDRRFTQQLVELGREDARRREDDILELLST